MNTLQNFTGSIAVVIIAMLNGCGGGGGSGTVPTNDTTAPHVISVTPTDGAKGVALDSAVSASFSEQVVAVSAEVGLQVTGPSGWVSGTGVYDSASHSVTFIPTSPFDEYTQYDVTVNNIVDLSGNVNTQAYSWNFTSLDLTPPCYLCVSSWWDL